MTKLELAEYVVERMDISDLIESAIIGINDLYESDDEKFKYDLENMGFKIGESN